MIEKEIKKERKKIRGILSALRVAIAMSKNMDVKHRHYIMTKTSNLKSRQAFNALINHSFPPLHKEDPLFCGVVTNKTDSGSND